MSATNISSSNIPLEPHQDISSSSSTSTPPPQLHPPYLSSSSSTSTTSTEPQSTNILPQLIIPPVSSTATLTPTPPTLTEEEQQRILSKEKSLNELKQQCSTLIHELEGNNEPELIFKKHIQQLHKYNELKDIALQLISLIADQRQVKISDILSEMNVDTLNDDNDTDPPV
ncbi:hypothetical protein SBY92_004875 [Candida maltosa Xu316]|uniref:Swi5-domain-containing protein n=1 Tax=Candida maltosa (strain Xu316) TaxID=1245528 RepID=M3IH49_CANMX|nr:hypothetical protein G210_4202 [Candida maltosa Xu316]